MKIEKINKEDFENKASNSTKNKKIIIAVIVAIVILGIIFIPKFLKSFDKKEVVCLNGQTEIYQKYKDAVVLVEHHYVYEISIKGSKPFQIDSDEDFLNEKGVYGTGFFVSQDGKIVTNHHVAEPWNTVEEHKNTENSVKEMIASILPDSIPENQYKSYLEKHISEYYGRDGEDYDNETNQLVANDSLKKDSTAVVATDVGVKEFKKVSIDQISLTPKSTSIRIALHGSIDAWLDCEVIKIAENEEVDVAVLQLLDKTLPSSVTNVIDLNTAFADDEALKPGSNAILIGYPMGMTLANTNKGIKVQVYEGQINKESDGIRIQYNITSTHGASGSPVFNQCGQLIAINYAGYDEAQGYNFGIVAKHALELVE